VIDLDETTVGLLRSVRPDGAGETLVFRDG
jgi:hypothetical protein